MSIALQLDPAGFKGLSEKLGEIEARIPRAIAFGLNEGGDRVRTQVQRSLQKQTSLVAYGSVLRRVSTIRAFGGNAPISGVGPIQPGGLAYQIVVRGRPPTHISEFAYKAKTGPGGYVSAKMWGVDIIFKRSFRIKGSEGVKGLRARLSKDRHPIRIFDGPNLAEELGRGITPSVFILSAGEFVPGAIIKQLSRVL